MNKTAIKSLIWVLPLLSVSAYAVIGGTTVPDISNSQMGLSEHYCKFIGGEVDELRAIIDTHKGRVEGISKKFCRLTNNNNLAFIGFDTLSLEPTFAATYTKKLVIDTNKPLARTPYNNPASNVCNKLHGTQISFSAYGGGFASKEGEAPVCIFGDGSSISSWALVNAASGIRSDIKDIIRSQALEIDIPKVQ